MEKILMKAIETINLTKRFGRLTAVDSVNLEVDQGEIFGLLGPNGAGKTTFISMLCTILKPTSGTAKVEGYDVNSEAADVRRNIGIVFQDPSIDDRLTGMENMEMHADLYNVPRDVMHQRIDEVLELVELKEHASRYMNTYSGGMRRRLEIARSLIHYPRVLFLDEPTIGLDPQTRDHIWNYIKDLKRRENITIILTTHYMDEADELCDRIAIIDKSQIIALDTPRNLKSQLEGETIIIESNDNDLLSTKINESELADNIIKIDKELNLTVENAHTTLARIVELAVSVNVRIDNISIREPDLDDVFMYYTGREIRENGGGKELTGELARRRGRIQ